MKLPSFVGTIALVLTLSACRSSKQATTNDSDAANRPTTVVERINANKLGLKGIRSKINLKMEAGKKNITVGGTLKMKRDEVIQLMLTPFGLVEAGRMELTPDYLLIQDRIGHQYVKVRWKDLKALEQAGIDFYTFQSLFWEELFIPGRSQTLTDADFEVTNNGESFVLAPSEKASGKKALTVKFLANGINGLIQHSLVTTTEQSNITFDWQYKRWTALEKKDFPEQMMVSVSSGEKKYQATFSLSHVQSDNNMGDIRTEINTKRYKKVDMNDIINRLMQM